MSQSRAHSLFDALQVGDMALANRVAMAPLTRKLRILRASATPAGAGQPTRSQTGHKDHALALALKGPAWTRRVKRSRRSEVGFSKP